MINHKWHYKTLQELKQALDDLNLRIPFSGDLSVLSKPITVNGTLIHNRIVYQPMEGGDCHPDGSPGEQTIRRYNGFAKGGPGIIWAEATPVLPEARSNPRQMYLHEGNLPEFSRFVDGMRAACYKENNRDTFIIIQFTHSGRYSNPRGMHEPIIARHNPYLERRFIPDDSAIISDEGLKRYEDAMGKCAALAEKAGFDGADVKCCHGYLAQELLSAHDRPGPYGGSFENRTRLFLNCVQSARASTKNTFTVTSRLNLYDGCPHPWGFGATEDGTPDMAEPLRLVKTLRDGGMELLNLTMGSPSIFTMTCPRDNGPEHPLEGVARMLTSTGEIKKVNENMVIVSSAYSYLRKFSPMAAAGSVSEGQSDMVGYGRLSFAYPDAARDILADRFDEQKLCLCCNSCGYPCRFEGRARH